MSNNSYYSGKHPPRDDTTFRYGNANPSMSPNSAQVARHHEQRATKDWQSPLSSIPGLSSPQNAPYAPPPLEQILHDLSASSPPAAGLQGYFPTQSLPHVQKAEPASASSASNFVTSQVENRTPSIGSSIYSSMDSDKEEGEVSEEDVVMSNNINAPAAIRGDSNASPKDSAHQHSVPKDIKFPTLARSHEELDGRAPPSVASAREYHIYTQPSNAGRPVQVTPRDQDNNQQQPNVVAASAESRAPTSSAGLNTLNSQALVKQREHAKAFLEALHSAGYSYKQLLQEGLDPSQLRSIFKELNIDTSIDGGTSTLSPDKQALTQQQTSQDQHVHTSIPLPRVHTEQLNAPKQARSVANAKETGHGSTDEVSLLSQRSGTSGISQATNKREEYLARLAAAKTKKSTNSSPAQAPSLAVPHIELPPSSSNPSSEPAPPQVSTPDTTESFPLIAPVASQQQQLLQTKLAKLREKALKSLGSPRLKPNILPQSVSLSSPASEENQSSPAPIVESNQLPPSTILAPGGGVVGLPLVINDRSTPSENGLNIAPLKSTLLAEKKALQFPSPKKRPVALDFLVDTPPPQPKRPFGHSKEEHDNIVIEATDEDSSSQEESSQQRRTEKARHPSDPTVLNALNPSTAEKNTALQRKLAELEALKQRIIDKQKMQQLKSGIRPTSDGGISLAHLSTQIDLSKGDKFLAENSQHLLSQSGTLQDGSGYDFLSAKPTIREQVDGRNGSFKLNSPDRQNNLPRDIAHEEPNNFVEATSSVEDHPNSDKAGGIDSTRIHTDVENEGKATHSVALEENLDGSEARSSNSGPSSADSDSMSVDNEINDVASNPENGGLSEERSLPSYSGSEAKSTDVGNEDADLNGSEAHDMTAQVAEETHDQTSGTENSEETSSDQGLVENQSPTFNEVANSNDNSSTRTSPPIGFITNKSDGNPFNVGASVSRQEAGTAEKNTEGEGYSTTTSLESGEVNENGVESDYEPPEISAAPNADPEISDTNNEDDEEDYEPPDNLAASPQPARDARVAATSQIIDEESLRAVGNAMNEASSGVVESTDVTSSKQEPNPRPSTEGPLRQNSIEGTDHFEPYVSPLRQFRDYRFHPNYLSEVSGGFRSLTYSNNIDEDNAFCEYETAGGICNDKDCDRQHFRTVPLSDEKIFSQLGGDNPGSNPEQRRLWVNKLSRLFESLKRENQHIDEIAANIATLRRSFADHPFKTLTSTDSPRGSNISQL